MVVEPPGRQGNMNFANTISHAVRVFALCKAAVINVHVVHAQIRLVEKPWIKLKKKACLIHFQEREKKQDLQQDIKQTDRVYMTSRFVAGKVATNGDAEFFYSLYDNPQLALVDRVSLL